MPSLPTPVHEAVTGSQHKKIGVVRWLAWRGQAACRQLRAGLMVCLVALLMPALAQAATYAYVVAHGSNSLIAIDTATNTVVATIPVGSGPYDVAANPAGTLVYVVNSFDRTVSVISTATNTVVSTIPVGIGAQGVAVHPAGTFAYIAENAGGDSVAVIDTATNTVVTNIPVPTAFGVAVHPAGTFVYATTDGNDGVAVIDTSSNTVVTTIPVPHWAWRIAVHPAGTYAYVTSFSGDTTTVIDTATNTVVATIPATAGSNPYDVAVNPAGTLVYVTNQSSNTVSVIDTATNTVVATIPVGSGPEGVAFNSTGTLAYIANYASGTVSVIDTATNTVIDTVPGVTNAWGVVVVDVPVVQLSLSKSAPSPGLQVGVNSTYLLTVTNSSVVAATTAQVLDVLPANMTLVSATGPNWTCSNAAGTITCDFTGGTIAAGGGTSTIAVVMQPTAAALGTSVTNYASIDPTGGNAAPPPGPTCTPAASCTSAGPNTVAASGGARPGTVTPVPTLSPIGLMLLAALVAGSGLLLRRRGLHAAP